VEIAISTGLLAEWYVQVYAGHKRAAKLKLFGRKKRESIERISYNFVKQV
jgi:hypothetical protein